MLAGTLFRSCENGPNVGPYQPMRPQLVGTVAGIVRPCTWALCIYIDTDARRPLFHEPLRELPEQHAGNASASVRCGDVEVLQLALAAVPATQMTRDVANHGTADRSQICYSWRQRLLRVMATLEVRRHPGVGGTGVMIGPAARSHCWDVCNCGATDVDITCRWIHEVLSKRCALTSAHDLQSAASDTWVAPTPRPRSDWSMRLLGDTTTVPPCCELTGNETHFWLAPRLTYQLSVVNG